MKTKETIIAAKKHSTEYPDYISESNVFEAMDEYSREVAIDFNDWRESGKAWEYNNLYQRSHTNAELFDLYLKERSEK